ncbi:unnamed protein product [Trichogramma brassicae]|uniref:Uncharacterized protein n=1 Tax=Trichogramma brassicae TaxID=86971 RepID=A0A6H5HZ09_9HYME|nr:unnamed protein product [Trichogramma brassicae]
MRQENEEFLSQVLVDISKETQDKLTIPVHNQPYAIGVHYSSTTYSCDALIWHVESENLRARTTIAKDEHLQYRSYASGVRIRAGNDAARLYNYANRRCSSCATAYIFNKSRALHFSVIDVEDFYQSCVRQFLCFEKVAISIADIATLHFDSSMDTVRIRDRNTSMSFTQQLDEYGELTNAVAQARRYIYTAHPVNPLSVPQASSSKRARARNALKTNEEQNSKIYQAIMNTVNKIILQAKGVDVLFLPNEWLQHESKANRAE